MNTAAANQPTQPTTIQCPGQYRGQPCPRPVVPGKAWCDTHVKQRLAMGWDVS